MSSSVIELTTFLRRTGLLTVQMRAATGPATPLLVPVTVLDAKRAYGNLRLYVTPTADRNTRLNGHRPARKPLPGQDCGAIWVDAGRVQLDEVKA